MILGFRERFKNGQNTFFEDYIQIGVKKHSIREDQHNRWKPGMLIQFAYGVRTKSYRQFNERVCLSVQTIKIETIPQIKIVVDDRELSPIEVAELIYNDGFTSQKEFTAWFKNSFSGKIIHWTDLKY